MNKAKYLLCVVLLAGILGACTVDEGDEKPRRTQGEYAVYANVYILQARAIENLRMVYGFDAYLQQTTDAGREAVAARFFPWAKVIAPTESGWRIQDDEPGEMYYDFMFEEGLQLDQSGASWQVYCRYSSSSDLNLIASLTNNSGEIHYKGFPGADGWVDWVVDVTLSKTDFVVVAGGAGGYEYESDSRREEEVWTVESRIGTPLHWGDSKRCFHEGSMRIKALLASNSPRTIEFDAKLLRNGVRITTLDGMTETWYEGK